MDLNKAMVDLYKKRSSANMPSRYPSKRSRQSNTKAEPPLDNKTDMSIGAQDPMISQDDTSKKKHSKIEQVISSLNLKPETTFDQLHGVEYAQGELLQKIDKFKRFLDGKEDNYRWPILICGSRGLGKTSLVEAAANHAQLNLIPIKLVQMVRKTRNECKEDLEHLIRHSIANQPSIVLFDDLDRLEEEKEYRYLICDAIERLSDKSRKILIICTSASTLHDVPDMSFQCTIMLKRPTLDARFKILKSSRRDEGNLIINLSDENIYHLATITPSFTAYDLIKMLHEAETESGGTPTLEHCEQAIAKVKSSLKRGTHLIGEKPQVTWNDIGGMSDVRQAFADILRQIRRPGRDCRFAGIALYGPPGCGKTMAARAMANEGGFNFISIKSPELINKFLGETEKNIRRVFQEAREYEPCVIYFDEFDGLCGSRGNKDNVTSAIQTLLSEMDGFESRGRTIIVAATNRFEDIDPAILRPGRLTEHIYVGLPGPRAREVILNVTINRLRLKLADDINLDEWVKKTKRFSGAGIFHLVDKAEAKAIRELSNEKNPYNIDNTSTMNEVITLNRNHFKYAIKKIKSKNNEQFKKTRSVKRIRIN